MPKTIKPTMKHLSIIIRLLLTILLLWQVFTHSHWSVGVCLTLIFTSNEVISYMLKNQL